MRPHQTRKLALLFVFVVASLLIVSACGGDDDSRDASLPESVRAAIDAVENGDAASLASQVVYSRIQCTTSAALGGPPECGPGQAAGTEVEVMPASGCGEASYVQSGSEPVAFENFLAGEIQLHAAYRSDGGDLFTANYAVLLTSTSTSGPFPGPQGRAIFLNDEGVTGLFFGCNNTVDEIQSRFATGEPLWTR